MFADQRALPFGSPGELDTLFPSIEGTKRRTTTRLTTTTSIVAVTILAFFAFGSTRTIRHPGTNVPDSGTVSSISTRATEQSGVITSEITEAHAHAEALVTTAATTTVQATKTSEIHAIEDKHRRFTTYQVSWGAYHPCIFPYCVFPASSFAGCMLGAGPSIQISCGDGGRLDFAPQPNCRLETQTKKPRLRCQGTTDLTDMAQVTCHGTRDTAIQLEVQVEQHTYQCNGILNEHHSFGGIEIVRGGTAGQRVSVSTLQDSDTWSEIMSESQTGGCSTQRQCSDAYVSCEIPIWCGAYVPYIFGSVAKEVATAGASSSDGVFGTPCTFDHDCQSGKCSNSTCN